mmetsp:Transcript_8351/g.8949  ORF Transcript_8351/g.8949 Transcript_8351/m.8949 type:complete len:89 (+) Transcript_8351:426-692(+)
MEKRIFCVIDKVVVLLLMMMIMMLLLPQNTSTSIPRYFDSIGFHKSWRTRFCAVFKIKSNHKTSNNDDDNSNSNNNNVNHVRHRRSLL